LVAHSALLPDLRGVAASEERWGFGDCRGRPRALRRLRQGEILGHRPRAEENARYNFRFRTPGESWARVDPAHIDPGAALAYGRAKPDVSFLLYASRPGEEMGLTHIVEDWKKQLAARATEAVEVNATPLVIKGVRGSRAVAVATVQSTKVAYENWIIERNGYSYQLVAWDARRTGQRSRGKRRRCSRASS